MSFFVSGPRIKKSLLVLLAFMAFSFCSLDAFAQPKFDYEINGTVVKSGKKVEGAVITLLKGSSQVAQVTTSSNGKFDLSLELGFDYTMTVSKAGCVTKKFFFSTKGLPDDVAKDYEGGTKPEISIFDMPKDPAVVSQINSILSQPMAKFMYDDRQKDIVFDKEYSQSMLAALDKLAEIEKEAIKKEAEEAKAKAQMESVSAGKYDAAIMKGDAAFNKKDYATAKTAYQEALSIKAGEAYPKGKIVEIEKLLADAAKNAALEADYKAAIAKGDAAMTSRNYEVAKTSYSDALKLKPAEAYPKTKLDEIAKILADAAKNAELEEKYKAALAKADAAFSAKTYDPAKAAYNEALGLKPAEKYPKDKLAEIDKILADIAAKEKAEKELQAKYDAALAKGDKALAAKDYAAAKAGYTEASGLKPAEAYPKTKLAEIDKLLGDLAAKEKAEKELEAKYKEAIAKGDAGMGSKDYNAAKSAYTAALALKANEQYPKDKLSEISKILADLAAAEKAEKDKLAKEKELNDKYNAAIAKGDAAFSKKDYAIAKAGYTEASALKASEQYPKDKLAEVEKALADAAKAAELEAKYKAAITKADAAFKAKKLEEAKSAYNEALAVKSAEQYPKDKLAEIDGLLAKDAAAKELNDKYNAVIAKADAAFAAKTYDAARSAYNEALSLKAAEAYPKTRLAEIDKILADIAAKEKAEADRLAKEKELTEKYNAAIAKGDAAFGSKEYEPAKAAYTEAAGLKPAEKYPKDKIAEINTILTKEMGARQLEEKYKAAIAKADAAMGRKEYAAAKTGYTEASALKASEQYPKDKLAEIEKAMAEIAKAAELEAKYKAAITKGDAALKAKTYDPAKAAYNEALGLKPGEAYPKDKIAEIDALIAKEMGAKELDEKYKAALAKGDNALKTKSYEEAKAGYGEALGFKPAEAYPKTKLAEIEKILADIAAKEKAEADRLAKEKELTEKYNAAIAKGDAAFGSKEYEPAKAAYTEAGGLKPAEKYPKDKIAEINAILAKEMGAKQLEEKYNAAIAKGDAGMGAKDYAGAKTSYTAALALKPNEQYPKDKLAEAEKALAELAAEKEKENAAKALEAKYKAAIAKGDAALKLKSYDPAKAAYNEALGIKAGEQYPKDKIAEIDQILADIANKNASAKELDEKYKAAVAKGDAGFAAKDYDAAKAGYGEALGFKPAEKYPKDKLAAIDALLAKDAKEKELTEKYNAAIAKGDAAFGSKEYEPAKAAYTEAGGLKPAEKYPKDKIAEINAILAKEMGAKQLEEKYNAAIAKGDAGMVAKDYAGAKTSYTAALALKPNEQYPKDKLAEAEKALAELAAEKEKENAAKALEAKYKAAIAKGDAALKLKSYDPAKAAYNEALGIKSGEQYPKDKIAEIDQILADIANKNASAKELDEKYKAAVAKGDAGFAAKDYDAAKAGYGEALGFKPAEKYPKDKLAAIDALLAKDAKEKELTEKYNAAIAKGDEAFAAKDYTGAKANYAEASGLKPAEVYPKDQLTKINALLAELSKGKALQEKYDAAVSKGDAAFGTKDYTAAMAAYKEAQTLKPSEPYPAGRISEINKALDAAAKAKEKEKQYLETIAKADKLFAVKDYKAAKSAYLDASLLKPTEKYPKDKVAECDVFLKKKTDTTVAATTSKGDFTSELAKKYPEGITEESATENNAKVVRRIVVKGTEGHLYVKKTTSFGPVYFFKDGVPITENEFIRDTEVQTQ